MEQKLRYCTWRIGKEYFGTLRGEPKVSWFVSGSNGENFGGFETEQDALGFLRRYVDQQKADQRTA